MIRKLSDFGNGLALLIDPALLAQLAINENTPLQVSVDGERLVVTPVRDNDRQGRFDEALAASNERYGKALKRLAE